PGAAAAALADGRILVAAAGATTLVAPDGAATPGPAITARDRAAAAVAAGSVVIAGGFDADGAARADADVIDASALTVVTVPLAPPRGGAQAIGVPNETALVIGGRDRDGGTPQGGAEVFTP